jgi:peptidoglycan hydrolase-like protein with peptidoglycan-binding domain
VSELQAILKLWGYYTGTVDGMYQDSTAKAVAAFQQSAGLPADGVVGVETWSRLLPASLAAGSAPVTPTPTVTPSSAPDSSPAAVNPGPSSDSASPVELPVLRMGMQGPAVARLQERLRAIGFYDGAIDGIFGSATQDAVKAAQQNYDLNPDGVVGPETWTSILK